MSSEFQTRHAKWEELRAKADELAVCAFADPDPAQYITLRAKADELQAARLQFGQLKDELQAARLQIDELKKHAETLQKKHSIVVQQLEALQAQKGGVIVARDTYAGEVIAVTEGNVRLKVENAAATDDLTISRDIFDRDARIEVGARIFLHSQVEVKDHRAGSAGPSVDEMRKLADDLRRVASSNRRTP